MKKPSTMKTLLVMLVLLACSGATARAQLLAIAEAETATESKAGQPKLGGTYLSATGMMPPLPYHPYPDLPTFEVGKNQFTYDDSKVDYAAIRAESAKQTRAIREARFQEEAEGDGPGSPPMQFREEGLRLVPKQITNHTLLLTIAGNDPALPYDLYSRTNIVGTNAWTYLGRQAAGVTNITVPQSTNGAMFFQLGTTYDGDGDYIPDAFEVLVAQLDPNTANTAQTIPAGNPAFQFYTNIPPVILTRSQDGVRRYIQLWPDGRRPGYELTNTWQRGQEGIRSTNYIWQGLPPLTNFISGPAWDADGYPLHPTAGVMPVDGWIKRDWSDLYAPGANGVGHDKSAKVTTKVDLYTRGYRNSTNMSLNTVLVDVYTIPGDPDSQVPGVYIPGEDITVLGEHPVERLVWKMLPDNYVIDATPVVSTNYTNYAFTLVPRKINLRIYRDNIDITDGNEVIWVGEEAKMDCRLDTQGYNLSNFLWTIPPLAISNYYADRDVGRVDSVFSKTNNEVKYYWVDGAQNAVVQAQAVVNGFPLTAKTTFQVRRPNARITAAIHSPVTVDNNFQFTPALHFGNKNAIVGIRFTNTTDHLSPLDFDWVQVGAFASRYLDANDGFWYRAATNGLDTSFPYGGESLYTAADSPGIQLKPWYLGCSHGNAFTMYLIFKPPVTKPKIWVPLRSIVWGWSGQATNSAGNWILVPNSGSSTVHVPDSDATAHPTWERNIADYFQQFVRE